ncbi:MAG: DUF4058 family protein [Fimbriimonadales bacterium]|nr:DUF4058 family protein [Fimbriimonadales bacterium]
MLRGIAPNVVVHERTKQPREGVAVLEVQPNAPIVLEVAEESHTEGFLQILDREQGFRVVTVIEVLSPTNKEPNSKGRELYLGKQSELLQTDTHLVEIDLLRGGEYTLAPPYARVSEHATAPWHYLISVRWVGKPERFLLYPCTVRESLPEIPIPLAPDDGYARLDLQAVPNQCYEDGAYADVIDYRQGPPPPPFAPEDAAWIDALLRAKGVR